MWPHHNDTSRARRAIAPLQALAVAVRDRYVERRRPLASCVDTAERRAEWRPERDAVEDAAPAKLVVDNLQARANVAAHEKDARACRALCRLSSLAALEAVRPDVTRERVWLEDGPPAVDIAPFEAVARACDVEGHRVGEVYGVVDWEPHVNTGDEVGGTIDLKPNAR